MSEFMDEVLPKLAVVTQKVNTYTGTDYSSIAALKQEIKDQGTASRKFLKSTPV
jgi:sensitive to high expression protein 9